MSSSHFSPLLFAISAVVFLHAVQSLPVKGRVGEEKEHDGVARPDSLALTELALQYQRLAEVELDTIVRLLSHDQDETPVQPSESATGEPVLTSENFDDSASTVNKPVAVSRSGSPVAQRTLQPRGESDLASFVEESDNTPENGLTDEQQTAYANALANYLNRDDNDATYREEEESLTEAQQQLTEEEQNSVDNSIADYFNRP